MPDNVNGVCTKEEANLYYTSFLGVLGYFWGDMWSFGMDTNIRSSQTSTMRRGEAFKTMSMASGCTKEESENEISVNSVFLLNMPWQMVRLWPTEFEAFCLSTSFDLSIFVFPAPSLPQHPSERGRRAGRASWSGSILQTAARVFLQCARQAGPPVTERLAQAVLNCSTPISTPPAPKSEPTSFMPRRYFNPRVIKGLVAIEKAQSRPRGGRPPVRVRPKDGIN